ncbi:prenyltransferase [Marinicella sp. S1101]|uniref:prenyltransferase n=1 Tax=Marinicella marina TaxID=2996016 RepID=UPI002260ED9F|nr:prenyltransferase [Marinicella marina]MCX7555127.1 prenyltransferase [Marinicella marina]MDJ1140336.1 prenyltransferase [Marinicella marina]
MNKTQAVVKSIRLPFLILTPVCVFLGSSLAFAEQANLDSWRLFFVLLGAMSAHISVNTLNEYFDFRSGLDLQTHRTPFSGGSGGIPSNPKSHKMVLLVGVFALMVSAFVGVFFVWQIGAKMLFIGLPGLILIVAYTEWINRRPWLCLIAPGLGFGLLMVSGTYVVLAENFISIPWLAALVPFFLINNLLLLNQYPDIEADAAIGRKNLPIWFGIAFSNWIYALYILLTAAVILIGVHTEQFSSLAWLVLLPLLLAIYAWFGARKHREQIGKHPQYLAANTLCAITAPLLLGVSFIGFAGQ